MGIIIAILVALGHGATGITLGWHGGPVVTAGNVVVSYVGGDCAGQTLRSMADEPCYVMVTPEYRVIVGPLGDDVLLGA